MTSAGATVTEAISLPTGISKETPMTGRTGLAVRMSGSQPASVTRVNPSGVRLATGAGNETVRLRLPPVMTSARVPSATSATLAQKIFCDTPRIGV